MSLSITRTLVEKDGKGFVEFNVAERPLPAAADLKGNQVLVAVEAAPINPSDIGPLFAPSHAAIGRFDGAVLSVDGAGRTVCALPVRGRTFGRMRGTKMVGRATRVGNEGAGRVVAAGASAEAQALMGKLVAVMGTRGTYGQHTVALVDQCLEHLDGTTAEEAASSFVNPLTALGAIPMHLIGRRVVHV